MRQLQCPREALAVPAPRGFHYLLPIWAHHLSPSGPPICAASLRLVLTPWVWVHSGC